jgi:hypothetical protein
MEATEKQEGEETEMRDEGRNEVEAEVGEDKPEDAEMPEEQEEDEEEDIYIPQAEYTAVCNADFAPLICNDFVSEFMEKEHGACQLDRADAIDLTRNFCFWIA